MKKQMSWLLAAVVAGLAFWGLQQRPAEAAFGGGGAPPLGKCYFEKSDIAEARSQPNMLAIARVATSWS